MEFEKFNKEITIAYNYGDMSYFVTIKLWSNSKYGEIAINSVNKEYECKRILTKSISKEETITFFKNEEKILEELKNLINIENK